MGDFVPLSLVKRNEVVKMLTRLSTLHTNLVEGDDFYAFTLEPSPIKADSPVPVESIRCVTCSSSSSSQTAVLALLCFPTHTICKKCMQRASMCPLCRAPVQGTQEDIRQIYVSPFANSHSIPPSFRGRVNHIISIGSGMYACVFQSCGYFRIYYKPELVFVEIFTGRVYKFNPFTSSIHLIGQMTKVQRKCIHYLSRYSANLFTCKGRQVDRQAD